MTHRTRITTLLISLTCLLVSSTALAQPGRDGPPDARGADEDLPPFLDDEIAEALELDELQAQVIDQLEAERDQDLEVMTADLDEIRSQTEALWASESPDRAAILSLGEWEDVMIASMREREIELRLDVLEVLSFEQRALLVELTADAEQDGGHGAPERSDGGDPGQDDDEIGASGEGRRRRGAEAGGRRDGLARQLGLDRWQRADVQTLREELQGEAAPIRELQDELREEMKMLWATERPDVDLIYEIGEDLDVLRSMLRELEVDFRLAVIDLLSLDQQVAFAELSASERGPRGR